MTQEKWVHVEWTDENGNLHGMNGPETAVRKNMESNPYECTYGDLA